MNNARSFADEHVLVIGGAGMIGSHLVDQLLSRRARVTVVDNMCSGSLSNLDTDHPALEVANLDIGARQHECPGSTLDRHIAEADFVYHLASPIGVGRAHLEGFDTTMRILQDGMNVVEACLRHRTPVLYTSSSEIYGKGGRKPLSETDTAGFGLEPRWGYGAAKMAVEHLVAGLQRDHGISSWIVRFFNVVGPRQNPATGLVVSAFCDAALNGRELMVHGNGADRRTFLHVLDAVSAILAIPSSPVLQGCAVNVGGQENISIRELAEKVVDIAGRGGIAFKNHSDVYGDNFIVVPDRRPSLERLMQATGWKPRYTLDEAVRGCFESIRSRATLQS